MDSSKKANLRGVPENRIVPVFLPLLLGRFSHLEQLGATRRCYAYHQIDYTPNGVQSCRLARSSNAWAPSVTFLPLHHPPRRAGPLAGAAKETRMTMTTSCFVTTPGASGRTTRTVYRLPSSLKCFPRRKRTGFAGSASVSRIASRCLRTSSR